MEALGEKKEAVIRLVVTDSDPETTKVYIHITVCVCVCVWISSTQHGVFQTNRHSRCDGCNHCTGSHVFLSPPSTINYENSCFLFFFGPYISIIHIHTNYNYGDVGDGFWTSPSFGYVAGSCEYGPREQAGAKLWVCVSKSPKRNDTNTERNYEKVRKPKNLSQEPISKHIVYLNSTWLYRRWTKANYKKKKKKRKPGKKDNSLLFKWNLGL